MNARALGREYKYEERRIFSLFFLDSPLSREIFSLADQKTKLRSNLRKGPTHHQAKGAKRS